MAPTRRILLLLFLISGSLRLALLASWIRFLLPDLGSTPSSIGAILAAALAAMASGSVLLGRFVDRSGKHPLAVHGLLEIGIGLFAVLSPLVAHLPRLLIAGAGGLHDLPALLAWTLRFVAAALLLGIPSAMMGGSLPALARARAVRSADAGWAVGSLHAAALLGASAGAGAAWLLLFREVGVRAVVILGATGSLALGLLCLEIVRRWWRSGAPVPGPVTAAIEIATDAGRAGAGLLALAAGGGLAATLYLAAWRRVLGLVLGPSIQANASVVVVLFAGLGLGAAIGSRISDRLGTREGHAMLAVVLGGAALAGHATFVQASRLPVSFALAFHGLGLAGPVAPGSFAWTFRFVAILLVMAVVAILPATIFLGTVFPLLVRLRVRAVEGLGSAIGSLQGAGLAGVAAGAAATPSLVIPLAGMRNGILLGLLASLAVAAAVAWAAPGWRLSWRAAVTAGAAGLAVFVSRGDAPWSPYVMSSGVHVYATDWLPLDLADRSFAERLTRGESLLYHREGAASTVLVSRDARTGSVWMSVDGEVAADSREDLATRALMGHLPMLHLRKPPGRAPAVAILGSGGGATLDAVRRYRPARVVIVEPEPAVLEGAAHLPGAAPSAGVDVKALHVPERSWLRAAKGRFDVIVVEPGGFWIGSPALLTTREALEEARGRLRRRGILALRVPAGTLDPGLVRMSFRTFTGVFPHVKAYMAGGYRDIILLGSDEELFIIADRLAARLESPGVAEDLAGIGVRASGEILTYLLMNDGEARDFSGGGAINTDDDLAMELAAPLCVHAATPDAIRLAAEPRLGDPLQDTARALGPGERLARDYDELGEAFLARGMIRRALAAAESAQRISPTPARASVVAAWSDRVPGSRDTR